MCSFEYTNDSANHSGPCRQCQEDGHQPCIAGPRPGTVRSRVRIGEDGKGYTNQPVARRPKATNVSTCKRCVESRRMCSFTSEVRGAGDRCTACDMAEAACQPLGVQSPQQRSYQLFKVVPSPEDVVESCEKSDAAIPSNAPGDTVHQEPSTNSNYALQVTSPGDENVIVISTTPPRTPNAHHQLRAITLSPDPPEVKSDGVKGTIKTVRTKFCHPLHFQDVDEDASGTCHFCTTPHFAMLGLEEKQVEVIEWRDGRGWEEIRGGHRGDGVQSTRICSTCTMARMTMLNCTDHRLRRFHGNSGADLESALAKLFEGDQAVEETWCSVCPNLAGWECCTERDGASSGCGLMLCRQCADDVKKHGGYLDTMLQMLVDEQTPTRPFGLRADYELLKTNGLLMSFICKEAL